MGQEPQGYQSKSLVVARDGSRASGDSDVKFGADLPQDMQDAILTLVRKEAISICQASADKLHVVSQDVDLLHQQYATLAHASSQNQGNSSVESQTMNSLKDLLDQVDRNLHMLAEHATRITETENLLLELATTQRALAERPSGQEKAATENSSPEVEPRIVRFEQEQGTLNEKRLANLEDEMHRINKMLTEAFSNGSTKQKLETQRYAPGVDGDMGTLNVKKMKGDVRQRESPSEDLGGQLPKHSLALSVPEIEAHDPVDEVSGAGKTELQSDVRPLVEVKQANGDDGEIMQERSTDMISPGVLADAKKADSLASLIKFGTLPDPDPALDKDQPKPAPDVLKPAPDPFSSQTIDTAEINLEEKSHDQPVQQEATPVRGHRKFGMPKWMVAWMSPRSSMK
jgi:hypothetical protein